MLKRGLGVLTDSRHFDYQNRPEKEKNGAKRVPRVWGVVCVCVYEVCGWVLVQVINEQVARITIIDEKQSKVLKVKNMQ